MSNGDGPASERDGLGCEGDGWASKGAVHTFLSWASIAFCSSNIALAESRDLSALIISPSISPPRARIASSWACTVMMSAVETV